jgi:hypothetical protein
MTVKTVVLNSVDRIGGVPSDCYIEIKDNLLQNDKKYGCRVKFINIGAPLEPNQLRTLAVVIDGLYCDDIYTSGKRPTPFYYCDAYEWTLDKALFHEPQTHLRSVRVNQNVLRVRFMNPDMTNIVSSVPYWILELQFSEIDE